jgi:hypothetical protein
VGSFSASWFVMGHPAEIGFFAFHWAGRFAQIFTAPILFSIRTGLNIVIAAPVCQIKK